MQPPESPLITTIKERCRVCYTCVRECPAKAIRIVDQQAEVVSERCIGCGNCVRVCARRAKHVVNNVEEVRGLLKSEAQVAAIIAPSFPAQFADIEYEALVGMMRALGFDLVCEVAFGADLVAEEYRRLLARTTDQRYIATSCPAIVAYVERYAPELVPSLAPIVSPMIAMARALRKRHGAGLKIVFVGPCVAKKGEAASDPVRGDLDAVLTFVELEEMFTSAGISAGRVSPSEFDPPHAGTGALFPIARGMLQAARITEDLMAGEVVAADGRADFVEAIKEFESGDLDVRLLELLCCNGCVMGAGISAQTPLFRRRAQVSRHVRRRLGNFDWATWRRDMEEFSACELGRHYLPNDQRVGSPSSAQVDEILGRMGKTQPSDELNCGACGYETCRDHAVAIFKGLAEGEMCLPYTIEQLRKTCSELTLSNLELASTKEALMQAEKLASMGQLAAGIAHEVNNPLGTVLMLSHVLLDEADPKSESFEDLTMIASEADRCKKIVANLLQFARKNKVDAKLVDLHQLVERTARMLDVPDNIRVRIENDGDACAEVDRDQIVQIITNLASNAIAAMPEGGTLTLRTKSKGDDVRLSVGDTGCGIPPENMKKIFEPFFTTKKAGVGTGLGLSVIYGIVKMHHGDIRVESNAEGGRGPTGTVFTVTLPRRRRSTGATGPAEQDAGVAP